MRARAPELQPPSLEMASPQARQPTSQPPPTLTLRAFLDQAGAAMLGGLPGRLWIEATIAAAKPTATGYALELTDGSGAGAGPGAQLRTFLGRDTLQSIVRELGTDIDPSLLVGMTTSVLVAPGFSSRWHLQARVLGLSRDAVKSLTRLATERLRKELQQSGLYDRQRRLQIPADVTRIAVVAPSGAAGHADIAAELDRWRAANLVTITSHPAPFEGDRAAAAMTAALMAAAEPLDGVRPDLILVVRGGGATASLQALDHETIVRAVCRCPVPIITGLGHAVDRTLVDEVAWRATDTPSKAVALEARTISTPAAAAREAVCAIARAAACVLAAHAAELTALQAAALQSARHRSERTRADLLQGWAALTVSEERLRGQLQRHADDLAGLWRVCGSISLAGLDDVCGASRRTFRAVLSEAERCAAAADAGQASLAAIIRAAMVRADAALNGCTAQWHDLLARVGDHLAAAQAHLAARAGEIAATDVPVQLALGFALVLDKHGVLIRTPGAARVARRVTLMLAGGTVAATVETPFQPRRKDEIHDHHA